MAREAAEMTSPTKEEEEEGEPSFPSLPPQVLFHEILSRLPVKTLLRLRQVCRSWRSVIDQDEYFISIHLSRSRNAIKILAETRLTVYFLGNEGYAPLQKGDIQFFPMPNFSIRSSCDGLLCLEAFHGGGPLHVANLATRQCVTLPIHKLPASKARICELVCDPLSGLYKLLLVQWTGSSSYSEITTLCKDPSWRELDIAFDVSDCWSFGVAHPCVSGAVHWTNGFNWPGCIVAFDIGEERFRTLAYPECCCGDHSFSWLATYRHLMCLVELDGFLHLLHFDAVCATMEMWVLKDYTNGIWFKEYDLGVGFIPKELQMDLVCNIPVSIINGEILLWVFSPYKLPQYLVSYHPQLRKFRVFNEKGPELENALNGVSPYIDSLVSLKQLGLPEVAKFNSP